MNTAIMIAQGLFGAGMVLGLRNNTLEQIGPLKFGRSTWVGLNILFAAGFMFITLADQFSNGWVLALAGIVATGIFGFILTAPHSHTLQGPNQVIKVNDALDPEVILDIAMLFTGHLGGAGDRLGWSTWVTYNALRYVLPFAMLGWVLQSSAAAVAGVLVVLSYWPLSWIDAFKRRFDPTVFGAAVAGFWIYFGL